MSFNRKIRVGVVGIGFGQQVHVPCFQSHQRCEVAAVAASTRERAEAAARRLGIERFTGDWRELAEDRTIDLLSIATPPSIQPAIALAAMAAGKAVLCEKPLAISIEGARAMMAAARDALVPNMIDLEFPELVEWQEAKRLIAERLGGVRQAAVSWKVETFANRERLASWKTRSSEGGGALYAFASHVLYCVEWLFGEARRIWAHLGASPDDSRDGDTLVNGCLELRSGAAVSMTVGTDAFLGSGHRIEVNGADASILLENTSSDHLAGFRLFFGTRESGRMELVAGGGTAGAPVRDGRIAAVQPIVGRLVQWIDSGIAAEPSFAAGFRVQCLLDAAIRSNQSGAWVEMAN